MSKQICVITLVTLAASELWWMSRSTPQCPSWITAPYPAFAFVGNNTHILHRSLHGRLLIAMPCHGRQHERALNALEEWKQLPYSRRNASVDFAIVYASTRTDARFRQRVVAKASDVFGQVCFVHYKLSLTQDIYPRATFVHFLNILVDAHRVGYEALLLMEPDVKVLRPHWADDFLALLDLPERWWIRASPWIGKRGTWSSMRRTNGNGLYRTDDPDAIRFIQWALQSEGFRGYDDQIWLAHADLMSTCWSARHLASRVVYTSLIVNLGLLCTTFNASSARAAYPDASIAHISGNF